MSRTVNGERLFDDPAKEVFRKQMWQLADYCGVDVYTYTVMTNHFHILVGVPQKAVIPDGELLRRYHVLYPKPTRYQTRHLRVIEAQLATNGPEAIEWRRRQQALMGNISQYMKMLKQRFSIWFNKSHRRYGTLWAERFKSVLVEPDRNALETIAAYIDLNCVRAGLVEDPKDYRFCGYAEAVAGNAAAQRGITAVAGAATQPWTEIQAAYRQALFGTAAAPREHGHVIAAADFQRVMTAGGQLPRATVLLCRLRYFTDGAVLGSRLFVDLQLARYRRPTRPCERIAPRPLPNLTDWGGLAVLRKLRGQRPSTDLETA